MRFQILVIWTVAIFCMLPFHSPVTADPAGSWINGFFKGMATILTGGSSSFHDIGTGQETNDCTSPTDPGPCRAAIQTYYYNTDTKSCEMFLYGGCKGNGNRYSSYNECNRICKDTMQSD